MNAPKEWTRLVINVLLIMHLTALLVAPFAFATQSGPGAESPLARLLMRVVRPYADLAFLNHGYFFFAPNPGPSCLVRYVVEYDDGRSAIEGTFPDISVHRPRLLYHRHFMLAEQWNAIYLPATPPAELSRDPDRLKGWEIQREMFQIQQRSFEQHISAVHGGGRVRLTRVEHRPAELFEVFEQGRGLTDPGLYRELLDEGPARAAPR